ELKLLPVVCSAFNPNSDNGIGGYGFWHLNYPQAIKYGLKIDRFIDERSDFEKSSKAASLYIKDLYTKYNDWELTIVAYSCGVSTLNKIMTRQSVKTYKEIYPFLPIETKDLVQAFVAMNYVYNYDNYGAVDLRPVFEMDTIQIENKLKFEAINYIVKTKSKEIRLLNPTLIKEIFPDNFTAYFPKGKGDKFTEFKDSIYFYQDSVMNKPINSEPEFTIPKDGEPYVYTVQPGDVLGLIADRNNVRVSQLQDWNGLSGTRINVGQKLTIYGPKSKKQKPKTNTPKKQSPNKQVTVAKVPKAITGKHSNYTVKSGDNLWIIAKKYSGVSAQNIMDFNSIDGNLNVGQVIKIPKY
ncbi:LysM peptidoglycan-binding domain-containing protein, partial [Vicingaceae bacterium]|nr:LysM peptidoglycan-binding domain-containing protein [Vicingaceae bacterium]